MARAPWRMALAAIAAVLCAAPAYGHGVTADILVHKWDERAAQLGQGDLHGSDAALADVVRSVGAAGWDGAWVYGEQLAAEAAACPDRPRALMLARAAAALAPGRPAALWALAGAGLRGGAWREATVAGVHALTPWAQSGPGGAAARARLALAGIWATVWAVALVAAVAQVTTWPLWAHALGHSLPVRGRSIILGALALALWAGLLLCDLGAVAASALLLLLAGPCLGGPMRRGAALALAGAAVGLLALPHVAAPLQHLASPAGARYYAVRDAGASWARARLPAAASASPRDLWALTLIARREGDANAALALGRAAVEGGVTTPELMAMLGNLMWEAHDFEAARDAYSQALAIAPDYAIARFNLSQALLSLARPNDAEVARTHAFADGGHKVMEQAASAQAQGSLLIEPPTPAAMGSWAPGDSGYGSFASALCGLALPLSGRLGPWASVLVALSASIALVAADWLQRARNRGGVLATACRRCGDVRCGRCSAGDSDVGLCARCQQAALGADAEALALRPVQEALALRAYSRRVQNLMVVSFLCPGLGLMLRGRALMGVGMATVWAWLLILAPWAPHQDLSPLWAFAPPHVGAGVPAYALHGLILAGVWLMGCISGVSDEA